MPAIVADAPVGWVPTQKPPITTVLGVTVADQAAAICAVRYVTTLLAPGDPMFGEAPIFETHYNVLGTQRLPAGSSYPEIARRVNTLAKRLFDRDDRGDYHVLVDASDVGAPVVDAIRNSIIQEVFVTSVICTKTDRGDDSILWRNKATVGLPYLVSRLTAILQGRRLHVPKSGDLNMDTLIDLLRDYDVANDTADLVRCLALACASEYAPVLYDVSPDDISSAAL